ncbi:hypothetical protein [Alteromonas sp. W364]|uniref:hypothetical protein n=1 Tax=Alteromonas sp. W364 TaxID=3075610 RepID=UPI002886438E|nr:hypothetical protein [Alteromonas sp. W364]MDT0629038.1 hypothetical protein [Alteromonas sp. W364]
MNKYNQTLFSSAAKNKPSSAQAMTRNTSNKKTSIVMPAVIAGFIFATAANVSIAEAAGTTVKSPDQVEQALSALLDTRKGNVDGALVAQVPTTYKTQAVAAPKASDKPDHSEKSVAELIMAGLAITNEAKSELAAQDASTVEKASVEASTEKSNDFQVKDIKTESELAALEQQSIEMAVETTEEAAATEAQVEAVVAEAEEEVLTETAEALVAVEIQDTAEQVEEAVVTEVQDVTDTTEMLRAVEVQDTAEQVEEAVVTEVQDATDTTEVLLAVEVEETAEQAEAAAVAEAQDATETAKATVVAKTELAAKDANKTEIPALPKVAASPEVPALPAIAKTKQTPKPVEDKVVSPSVENEAAEDDNYSMIAVSESAEEANIEDLSDNNANLYAVSESSETVKSQQDTVVDETVIDELEANVEVAVRAAGCPETFNQVDIPVNGKLCQIFAADYPASMILFIPQTPEEVVEYYLSSSVQFAEPKTVKQRTMIKSADNNTTLIISKDGGGTQVDILVKAPLS